MLRIRLLFRSRFDVALLLSFRYYSSIRNLVSELDIKSITLDLDERVAFKEVFQLDISLRRLSRRLILTNNIANTSLLLDR